ncbi:SPOSA6832_03754 [Sporobolomyces salmonicolor]|uniref:SPOSA6832_03754-mRNA-1:cds n=1 Tax=Sporidiobolus salmonicolor TaxID=5005 RepID=A0A0D6EQ85_SPOSA|nr:SPOSA6832_03754 [Sporobolomyces salmonicolor]
MDRLFALFSYALAHLSYSLAVLLLAAVVCTALYLAYWIFVAPRYSSIRDVPGPKRDSLLWGNMARIFADPPGKTHKAWMDEFGGAARYGGHFGNQRLVLYDSTALNHVLLSNAYDYPKPEEVRGDLAMILGKGVLFAEGEDHRRQRRILQPAFSPSAVKALTPVFFEHAYQLRDIWSNLIQTSAEDDAAFASKEAARVYRDSKPDGEVAIEVLAWLSRLTLDIIGVAGFGYQFNALSRSSNALASVFSGMFSPRASAAGKRQTPARFFLQRTLSQLIRALPVLNIAKWIPNQRIQDVRKGFETLESESRKIIENKQGEVEKDGLESVRGSKDLIALLLKSAEKDAKTRMTPEELRGQLTTFVLAGSETTSTALTWTLHALSRFPEKQQKLRDEIRAARKRAEAEGRDELESDELAALPYLDAVAREVLRLESPVTATVRHAARADLIPLSKPLRSASSPTKTISHIPVEPGQVIFIPIAAVNRSKEVFGDDADEFRPERWLEGEREIEGGVGVWAHILSFLAGPRSCIGYKFAILSVLIDAFAFALRDADMGVERRSQIVTRPLIVGEETMGNRMPLRVWMAPRGEDDA